MQLVYLIDDFFVDVEFEKVRAVTEINTNGFKDYMIYLDNRENEVLLSNITHVTDKFNTKHTENLLDFFKVNLKEKG